MSAESRAATVSAYSLVGLAALASILSSILGLRLLDEGYILYNSWLMSLGRAPYRDFWVLYPPGMFALLGGAFHVFGPWALVGRATVLLASASVAWSAYRLSAPLLGRSGALVCSSVLLAWGVPVYNTPFPNWYALALLFGASVVLSQSARAHSSPRYRDLVIAGLLTGLSAVVKQSIGLLAIAMFAVVVAVWLPVVKTFIGRVRSVAAYVGGAGLPVLALAGALMRSGTARAAVADLFLFPLSHRGDILVRVFPRLSLAGAVALAALVGLCAWSIFPWIRTIAGRVGDRLQVAGIILAASLLLFAYLLHPPTGGVIEVWWGCAWGLAFYALPLVALAVAVGILKGDRESKVTLAVLAAVGATMFLEAGGALDWSHLVYVVPSAFLILAIVMRPAWADRDVPWPARASLVLLVALMLGAPLLAQLPSYADLLAGRLVSLPGAYAGIFVSRKDASELEDVSGALTHAAKGASVYVYPVDAGLYFMAQRTGAGRFSQFVHRLSADELREEARTVRSARPAVVVARIAREDDAIGYSRWSHFGAPVLDSALDGLHLVQRTDNFAIYEGTGR